MAPLAHVEAEPRTGTSSSRSLGAGRVEIQRAGLALGQAWLKGDLPGLRPYLAERVWCLWPDGELRRCSREALLDALAGQSPPVLAGRIERVRSYGASEARSVLPAGAARAYEFVAGERAAWVTFAARVPEIGGVRWLVIVDEDSMPPRPRFACLPLPSPDEALVASAALASPEDPARSLAEGCARAVLLGHSRQLRARSSQFTAPFFWNDRILSASEAAEALERDAADRSHRCFGPSRRWPAPAAEAALGHHFDVLRREGPKVWLRSWDEARPEWVGLTYGSYDGERERMVEARAAVALVVRLLEPDGTGEVAERRRVAALFTERSVTR
ncbi:MAG: hypothetical protein AAFZ18_08060 [Myxococcota bacterium]